jgi:D-glycerate 3-kinase
VYTARFSDIVSRMRTQALLSDRQISEFMARHRLPAAFRDLIARHYSPLASWLRNTQKAGEVLFVGINGAQGTGKSTLADYLRLALASAAGWKVAVLSIDDFYLTKMERQRLAEKIHPLLATRGVPGTHNMQMLASTIEQLMTLAVTESLAIPRFDKAVDDRAGSDNWPIVSGPIDLILLEGWCVGTTSQHDCELTQPVNSLEELEDSSGTWRHYVNTQLRQAYAKLFAQLDALIFLQAPGFDAIHRWRLEQEEKLSESLSGSAEGVMSADQILVFIQHYERLTRWNLETLPSSAEVVLELNDNHDCVRSSYSTAVS